jgi:type IV pilus assembly protein PilE
MKNINGFTLIELMIVVLIIGVIAAVAVPSYQEYIDEGRRAEGVAFAKEILSLQETHFMQFNQYATNVSGAGATALGVSNTSENGDYIATLPGATATTFTIQVSPNGWTDSDCGNLTLTNTGERDSSSGTTAECWK